MSNNKYFSFICLEKTSLISGVWLICCLTLKTRRTITFQVNASRMVRDAVDPAAARGRCSFHKHTHTDPLQSGRYLSLVKVTWFHPVGNVNVNKRPSSSQTNIVLLAKTQQPFYQSKMALRVCGRFFRDSAVLSRRLAVSTRQESASWFLTAGQWRHYFSAYRLFCSFLKGEIF